MNWPFLIAHRYLFSKKSTHAINIISGVSMVGVAVATMALMVTLSVFNGFHDLVASFFTSFDPPLKIMPAKGKTVPADDPRLAKVKEMTEVEVATECVEDQALIIFGDQQAMVKVKGVEDNFSQLTHIEEILYPEGILDLHAGNLEYGIPGIRLAQDMGLGARWPGFLHIYAPQREGQFDMADPSAAFIADSLLSAGCVFSVRQAKYDKDYLITSIGFARNLFDQQGMLSSLELRLKPDANLKAVKKKIKAAVGEQYVVLDRYEQQADTFNIMNIEKAIAYLFLTFILMVACFNIIGSLSMLIIDKKEDAATLSNMGATQKQISRIFLYEGRMISAIGAVVGIGLGLLLCWLQQTFGLVSLGSSSGSFVVDAYPVSVHLSDVVLVFITVLAVGWLAVWYPVRYFSKVIEGK